MIFEIFDLGWDPSITNHLSLLSDARVLYPQLTEIGISIVSNSSKHSETVIDKVLEYIEGNFPSIEVIEIDREILGGF